MVNFQHEREGLLEEVAAEEKQMEKLTDILSTIEVLVPFKLYHISLQLKHILIL